MVSWDLDVACRATRTSPIKFSKTNMGRSDARVTPGLLANLVASAALHDEKLDQHFEVSARDGKLFQSQYAKEAGGSEIFRETHEVRWIMGSGTNGFAAVTTNGPYLFKAHFHLFKNRNVALSPGYEFGNYGFNRPIFGGVVRRVTVAKQCLRQR